MFSKIPDVERLLSAVHTLGVPRAKTDEHPAGRAVMYENETYGKRKVKILIRLLEGLRDCDKAVRKFGDSEITSALLLNILPKAEGGGEDACFPDIVDKLKWWVLGGGGPGARPDPE